METLSRRVLEQAAATLRSLGERPRSLLLALCALNALVLPYGGLIHDAQLYGAQVLNRLDDHPLGDDLFFRYGSQDQYSLFSAVMAPLVWALGLSIAFFGVYVLAQILLLLGMQRLVQALVPDRTLSTLALLVLAVSPLSYGWFGIFHVHEPYLTPRPLAAALVLLALERMLHHRYGSAFVLLGLGGLIHPLMTVPGLAVLAIWWAWERLERRHFLLLAGAVAGALAAVLAHHPLGARIFGWMDESWLAMVRHASPYVSPLDWPGSDQRSALLAGVVLLAAAWAGRRQPLGRLALLVILVAAAGVAASVIGCLAGYALLVQGQPYRALWLVAVLQVPAGLWLAARLWGQPGLGRLLALAVLACLGLTEIEVEGWFFSLAFPPAVVVCRGLGRTPRSPGWLWQSVAVSLVLAILGHALMTLGVVLTWRDTLLASADGLGFYRVVLLCPGSLLWTALAVAVLVVVQRRLGFGRTFRSQAAGAAVASQVAVFVIPATSYYQEHYQSGHNDVCFVAGYVAAAQPARHPALTVYWCNAKLSTLWLDLGVRSYYQLYQAQGLLFSHETALEAHRRALLVGRFEMEHIRGQTTFMNGEWVHRLESYYQESLERATATRADLERLCREEIDYVILTRNIDDLHAATNGRYYIYDCRQLRVAFSGAPVKVAEGHVSRVVTARAVDAGPGMGGGRRQVQSANGRAVAEPREGRSEE
jgi:hypothetical protein